MAAERHKVINAAEKLVVRGQIHQAIAQYHRLVTDNPNDEQPEGMIFVVPARLEPCELPQSLSRLHYADLFSPRGYENLKRALELRATQLGFG